MKNLDKESLESIAKLLDIAIHRLREIENLDAEENLKREMQTGYEEDIITLQQHFAFLAANAMDDEKQARELCKTLSDIADETVHHEPTQYYDTIIQLLAARHEITCTEKQHEEQLENLEKRGKHRPGERTLERTQRANRPKQNFK